MGYRSITLAFIIIVSLLFAFFYQKLHQKASPIHQLTVDINDSNDQWLETENIVLDGLIKSKRIHYSRTGIDQLRIELNKTLALSIPFDGQQYVNTTNVLKRFIKYWHDNYLPRWSSREKLINTLPHFVTKIQGYNIIYHVTYC